MKYYYLNKIAMAVLVALLLFFGTRTVVDILNAPPAPEKPGYDVAGAGAGDDGHGKPEKPVDEGAAFIVALNKADPAKGEKDVGLCKVCHSFEKGGPTMIGPNLYGVIGHKIAAVDGVNYSPALKDHGGDWTFENMDLWLKSPQAFAAGTTMAFPGVPDLQKRADIIAYLNQNSDDPLPIPEPKEAPAAEESAEGADDAADAGGGQPEIIALLATADAAKGDQAAALCKVCHTFDAGGAQMVGPNLHNIVGAKIAHAEGFNYSEALKSKGGNWTYEALDAWLTNPQAYAAGTTMAFPGVPDAKKRADLIKYMMSETDNPPPLPEAKPADAKPAEEEAAPDEEDAAPSEDAAAPAEEDAKPMEEEAVPPAESEAEMEAISESADETIVVPPTVSEDAPSEPHAGEPPSPNQPQPVVPGEAAPMQEEAVPDAESEAEMESIAESADETIVVPPTVSEDAPSEPHAGEPPSPNQPQPVVPGEAAPMQEEAVPDAESEAEMEDIAESADETVEAGDDAPSSQPQPVYPDGKPDGI